MGLVVYPPHPLERRPDPDALRTPLARYPVLPPKTNPDRILVGILAGTVLFYLLGKAIGLSRDPVER